MKKHICIFLICIVMLTASLSGCAVPVSSEPQATEAAKNEEPQQTPASAAPTQEVEQKTQEDWIVSDLQGSVTADMNIDKKDDFYAAVNRDWLADVQIPAGEVFAAPQTDRMLEVRSQMTALMTDPSQTSHEAKLVQTLYAQYMDMETRNALGTEPLREHIAEIQDLKSIADVREYISTPEHLWASMATIQTLSDAKDSTVNLVNIVSPAFSMGDADEYRSMSGLGERTKRANETMLIDLLVYAGMTEAEAKQIHENFFALETEIARASMGTEASTQADYYEKIYNPMTIAELETISPNYPLTDILKPYIDAGAERFNIWDVEWLKRMNELFTEENTEKLKAYLIRNVAMYLSDLLDQRCLDIVDAQKSTLNGRETKTDIADMAYQLCASENSVLGMAAGRMYTDAYISAETKEDVTKMAEEVIAVYRKRLEENDWLAEETRQNAIAKLDNMKILAAYPDDWSDYDYSGLALKSDEEGGSLIENYNAVNMYSMQQDAALAAAPADRDRWVFPPHTVNAAYNPMANSIMLFAGYLGGELYDPEASREERLATIGTVIGHEISHGFDNSGSQFDKDGNQLNWWTDADRTAFDERVKKVSDYYSQFEGLPGLFVNGELVRGEAVADLGGVSCMLEIAKGIPDFDYELFFETYTRTWRVARTQENMEERLHTNPHPPHYLRVNAIIQQFPEFYETYGVEKGDGMYLPPEERLAVW